MSSSSDTRPVMPLRGPGGGAEGFGGFAEAFGDIFGDMFGQQGGRRGAGGRQVYRGSDLSYAMEITLEEAARGKANGHYKREGREESC